MEIFYFLFVKVFNIKPQCDETPESSSFETTIHGIKYLHDKSLKFSIKVFWIIPIFLSVLSCFYVAHTKLLKLTSDPEIDMSSTQISADDISFPAITICSGTFGKSKFSNLPKFLNEMENSSVLERNFVFSTFLWCAPYRLKEFKPLLTFNLTNIVESLNRSRELTNEIMFDCKEEEKLIACDKIFKRVITKYGFCFSYNIENFHFIFNDEISSDFNSYGKNSNSTAKSQSVSKNSELSLFLKVSRNDSKNICDLIGKSFYIFIHKRNEIHAPFPRPYFVDFGYEKVLTLSAKSVKHESRLRHFKPINRGCYFDGEKKLKFFKSYSKLNCEFECLTNQTLKICGCIKFSMPRNHSMPICKSADEAFCYDREVKNFPPKGAGVAPCDCLDTCVDVMYDVKSETHERLSYAVNNLSEKYKV